MSERPLPHPVLARVILVAIGLVQVIDGFYALLDPRGFYDDFPAGRSWVAAYPAYNEHLTRDVGALFLATGALLLIAAVWLSRRLVIAATVSWLVFAVPHTLFHVLNSAGPDRAANLVTLIATVVLPLWLLASVTWERPRARRSASPTDQARIPLVTEPKGLVPRISFRESRRQAGTVLDPVRAYAHAPVLLAGYGAIEMATERSRRCDERLKELAVMRAAMLTGCEWCLDFGSADLLASGIPEADLKDLARYEASSRFSPLERQVLDYATGMTRTPVEVSDELVRQIRAQIGDPALVELTHHISLENLRARFNWALGIGSQGFSDGSYCVMPTSIG